MACGSTDPCILNSTVRVSFVDLRGIDRHRQCLWIDLLVESSGTPALVQQSASKILAFDGRDDDVERDLGVHQRTLHHVVVIGGDDQHRDVAGDLSQQVMQRVGLKACLQLLAEELDHPIAAKPGAAITRHAGQIGAGAVVFVGKFAVIGEFPGQVGSQREMICRVDRERRSTCAEKRDEPPRPAAAYKSSFGHWISVFNVGGTSGD